MHIKDMVDDEEMMILKNVLGYIYKNKYKCDDIYTRINTSVMKKFFQVSLVCSGSLASLTVGY